LSSGYQTLLLNPTVLVALQDHFPRRSQLQLYDVILGEVEAYPALRSVVSERRFRENYSARGGQCAVDIEENERVFDRTVGQRREIVGHGSKGWNGDDFVAVRGRGDYVMAMTWQSRGSGRENYREICAPYLAW